MEISGKQLVSFLEKLGYKKVRQKGSHIVFRKTFSYGTHNITVPMHKVIARGTLNNILNKISIWNNISKKELFLLNLKVT